MADNTQYLEISKQYLNKANKCVDAALQPAKTYTELSDNALANSRYEGMERIVLNSGSTASYPMKFCLIGGNKPRNWKIKQIFPIPTYKELDNLFDFVSKQDGMPISRFSIGLEATVVADETNDGKPTKYWITAIDTVNNKLTWERCNSAVSDNGVMISGNDMEMAESSSTE